MKLGRLSLNGRRVNFIECNVNDFFHDRKLIKNSIVKLMMLPIITRDLVLLTLGNFNGKELSSVLSLNPSSFFVEEVYQKLKWDDVDLNILPYNIVCIICERYGMRYKDIVPKYDNVYLPIELKPGDFIIESDEPFVASKSILMDGPFRIYIYNPLKINYWNYLNIDEWDFEELWKEYGIGREMLMETVKDTRWSHFS